MSDKYLFREAVVGDIGAIFVVRMSVLENVLSDPTSVTPQKCAEYLTVAGKGWVCEIDGEVVGFSIANSTDESIWALFILPKFEGQKIGRKLLDLATEWLFANGAALVSLSTGIDTRADQFYERLGWTRGEILANGEVRYRLDPQTKN